MDLENLLTELSIRSIIKKINDTLFLVDVQELIKNNFLLIKNNSNNIFVIKKYMIIPDTYTIMDIKNDVLVNIKSFDFLNTQIERRTFTISP